MKQVRVSIFAILSSVFLHIPMLWAQVNPNLPPKVESLPFLKLEADTIINAAALAPFFEKLGQTNTPISIAHIGDSHIQGDFFTGQMRKRFQADFGNAGRGFIFPYQVAKTNCPSAYKSSSNAKWEINKVIMPIEQNTNGLGGISISNHEHGSYLLFQFRDDYDSVDNHTKRLTMIHNKQTAGYMFKIKDWSNSDSFYIDLSDTISSPWSTQIEFKNPTLHFGIENNKWCSRGNETIIYGMVAENGQEGILYHAIGVNGAEFKHYIQNPLFFRQIPTLKPHLFILSMGTNEAQDWKRSNDEIILQINKFLDSLTWYNPSVPVLLTTPIESWRGKGRRRGINAYLPRVRECIMLVAQNRNMAIWDLYTVSGGYRSSLWWKRYKLFSRDMVHHSVAGYRLQGNLLYSALMKARDDYQKAHNH